MIGNNNEIKLLLSCSKPRIDNKSADKIRRLLQEEIDWDWILKAARSHQIWPILYHNLKTICPEAVPQDVLSKLRRTYLFNAARNLMLTRELHRIIEDLHKHGIEAVPFKGSSLAQAAYGDITLRSFSDLDIMVKKKDVLQAKDLLISKGYQPQIKLTPFLEKSYLRSACEYNFARNDPSIVVEIHWAFYPDYFSIPFDEAIWLRLETMNLDGATINRFPVEDMILALCGHATVHLWDSIKMVSDIAGLMEGNHIDWERVNMNAVDMGMKRILHIGLLLAHNLLDIRFPEQMQDAIEKDATARNLALHLSKKLLAKLNRQEERFEKVLFWMRCRENWSGKAGYLRKMKPTNSDYAFILLPDLLYPLYYIIRPVRLFCKYGLKRKQMQTSSPLEKTS